MSVLKNKGINSLLHSEKKSLFRFLMLYITLVLLVIILLSIYYYQNQEKLMLSEQPVVLSKYAFIQAKRLKAMHQNFSKNMEYPRDTRFKSAIYDLEYMQIYSLLEDNNIVFEEGIYRHDDYIHFVYRLGDYYLGTKYLIIEVKDDASWQILAWKNIIVYGLVGLFLFILFGLYLAKLFLKPMRDSIVLLDRFIKDTTHELNTPLSAIFANIEMMDKEVMVQKNINKLNRINIATITVSNLYKDLTYLTLEQKNVNKDENIDLKALIYDRTEYFKVLSESKKLSCHLELEDATLFIDKRKFSRVIDNLISNAIKYSRREGSINIILQKNSLIIEDTGIGINEEHIPFMFDRYMRFNDTEGGFGVGLSIVKSILDEYKIQIKVDSKKELGTKVVLLW